MRRSCLLYLVAVALVAPIATARPDVHLAEGCPGPGFGFQFSDVFRVENYNDCSVEVTVFDLADCNGSASPRRTQVAYAIVTVWLCDEEPSGPVTAAACPEVSIHFGPLGPAGVFLAPGCQLHVVLPELGGCTWTSEPHTTTIGPVSVTSWRCAEPTTGAA